MRDDVIDLRWARGREPGSGHEVVNQEVAKEFCNVECCSAGCW